MPTLGKCISRYFLHVESSSSRIEAHLGVARNFPAPTLRKLFVLSTAPSLALQLVPNFGTASLASTSYAFDMADSSPSCQNSLPTEISYLYRCQAGQSLGLSSPQVLLSSFMEVGATCPVIFHNSISVPLSNFNCRNGNLLELS
jgi:hypothetical protein